MALLQPTDIQAALNIDVTDPNGQTLATSLITAAAAYVEAALAYPLEEKQVVTYFDGEYPRVWLPTMAPVTNLTMAAYTSIGTYADIASQYVRQSGNEDSLLVIVNHGFQSLRATYTTGWTAAKLPADLRQALIDLVGLKLQAVEYGSTGSEVMWKAKATQLSRRTRGAEIAQPECDGLVPDGFRDSQPYLQNPKIAFIRDFSS